MNALISSPKKQIHQPIATLVTIAFADVDILIPIADTVKILPLPEVHASGHGILGLAQVDDAQAIVIDLHHALYGVNQPDLFATQRATPDRYLVLLRGANGLQYGLATPRLPLIDKVEVDRLSAIATLESDQPHAGILATLATQFKTNPTGQLGYVIDVAKMITAIRQWAAT